MSIGKFFAACVLGASVGAAAPAGAEDFLKDGMRDQKVALFADSEQGIINRQTTQPISVEPISWLSQARRNSGADASTLTITFKWPDELRYEAPAPSAPERAN